MIYLGACRSDQRNYEVVVSDKGYGSLTYYFCEVYKNKDITNLPAFLSAIYSGMENDKTLKFHGQVPFIRNTIGWNAPSKVIAPLPATPNGPDETDGPSNQTVIWVIIAAASIVIFIALWITRKKKK